MVVKLGMAQEMKTEVKNRTLNPRYDETFDLLVYERSVEVRSEGGGLIRALLSSFLLVLVPVLMLVPVRVTAASDAAAAAARFD